MSLVLSTSVKANVRLEQAVKQFEAILTSHQATQFRAHRNAASNSPPTVIDVRNLLLDVDSLVRAKTSARRAFSPRLSSVVEAVQKFASIGDVLVGGSQNLIACGVWSIIRLALLSITTSLSTLERLSAFFMAIGRSAPRYEDLALLYPQSERLQMYLCEYHIILVNLCRELVIFTQKSTISLLVSSLSSSTWDNHQMSLEQWSTCIREEVSSLMAQTIENDSSLNSTFRAFVTGEMRKDSLMKQLKARRKALDACTTYDYEMTWRQQRKIGTTELFKDNDIYKRWKKATVSGTLIIDGKLGSGKTVMMANIIDDLRRDAVVNHANVAYFFCRHDVLDSLKERVILGSLVREILRTAAGAFPWEATIESLNSSTSTQLIVDVLLQSLPTQRNTYFVIDGIDECNLEIVRSLQKVLKTIQLSRKLAICVSLRTDSVPVAQRIDLLNQSIMVMPERNSDIDSYITMELERRIESGSLMLGDPTLVKDIYTTLVTGAKGMFLWVTLQIECLCFKKSDEQIRAALLKLPEDLPDLFARLLHEAAVGRNAEHDQNRILELVISAIRPLQEEEMREALSVKVGDTNWDASKLPNDIRSLLACCGSLIIVDEEDRSIRLVHHSVLQYLTESYICFDGALLTQHRADRSFADILITYLSYGVFETQVSKAYPKLPIRAMQNTIVRSTLSNSIKQKLAMQILKNVSRSNYDAGYMIGQATSRILESNESTNTVFYLHDYARRNLSAHAWVYFDHIEDHIVDLLSDLIDRDKELINFWQQNMMELDLATWSSKGNKGLALVNLLCEGIPPTPPGFTSIFSSTLLPGNDHPESEFLVWACTNGHSSIVIRWLDKIFKHRRIATPYSEKFYARAIHAAHMHNNYNIAIQVAKHVAELIPKLAFMNLWVSELIPELAYMNSWAREYNVLGHHQIRCSITVLDEVLQTDNVYGLEFLLDCNLTGQNRLDPITLQDTPCPISLYDRCIWSHSTDCLRLLQKRGANPHIPMLSHFNAESAKIRNNLLLKAIELRLEAEAIALIKVSLVEQRISEDERLDCLSLAAKNDMDDLIRFMLHDQGWFQDGNRRSLNIHPKYYIKETVTSVLRKSNLHVRRLNISSPIALLSSTRLLDLDDISLKPELERSSEREIH